MQRFKGPPNDEEKRGCMRSEFAANLQRPEFLDAPCVFSGRSTSRAGLHVVCSRPRASRSDQLPRGAQVEVKKNWRGLD